MQIITDTIHNHNQRDSYWTKVRIVSNDHSRETALIVCASHEFLSEELKTDQFTNNAVQSWLSKVTEEWSKKGELVFHKPLHLDVRTVTDDGYKKTLEFLREEIIPRI